MPEYKIRAVKLSDAERLAEIYNPYILETTITYEYEPVDGAEFQRRIKSVWDKYPYIVLEEEGKVAGYAYASAAFNGRKAYGWDCDLAIYLDKNVRGKGRGKILFAELLRILSSMGYMNAYSLIDVPNPPSEALHKAFGFIETGKYVHSAWKFDRWLDMAMFEKKISDKTEPSVIDYDWRKYL